MMDKSMGSGQMMAGHDMGAEGSDSYPGIQFSPPEGTLGDETEGQAMVTWKKVGDAYTIVEFEGKPIGQAEKPEPQSEDQMLEGAMAQPS